ncbi:unnamed protein product [Prunus armeniaca]
MGCGTLRPCGDLTTVSSAVSFTVFGFGLQYYGREAERILPLQLFFCFQEGEMLNETVGARTERKSLQSVYDRDLLGTNSLLQDIQTKEIIGCGTKRERLYYVDDVVPGKAHAVRVLHDLHCEVCILAKSHRASFPPSMNKRPFPFDLLHSDVWGPSPIVTSSGLRWFVTFFDYGTRMTWLYVLKNKSDVGAIFRSFAQMVQTQYSSIIKVLRSDNGGEYIEFELSEFLRGQGILHETTCPHTPQASVPPRF